MRTRFVVFGSIGAALLLARISTLAAFDGYFSGYYAPANWTRVVSGNPLYQNTGLVFTNEAATRIEIDGAVDAQQQITTPQPPASIIDYTIVLDGTGLQPVAFNYLFFTEAIGGLDGAALIYNGSVVANLDAVVGTEQAFSGTLLGGGTFGFRVYSDNDNLADFLQISVVPEPGPLALLGLGGAALWCRRRWAGR